MRCRIRGRLAVLAVSVALAALASTIAGQAQSPAKTSTWTPVRTPWGEPDLQGIWTIETITPLERPAEFAGREFLTEQEAAALETRTVAGRVDAPPRAGDPGTYNQFWFDRGTKVVQTLHLARRGSCGWTDSVELGRAGEAGPFGPAASRSVRLVG